VNYDLKLEDEKTTRLENIYFRLDSRAVAAYRNWLKRWAQSPPRFIVHTEWTLVTPNEPAGAYTFFAS